MSMLCAVRLLFPASEKKRVKINQAWLNLSYSCNNRCIWCYARENVEKSSKKDLTMSFLDSQRVLSFLKEIGVEECALVGGDPTVYRDLFSVMDYAKEIGLKITIVTNGRKLSNPDYFSNLLKHVFSGVSISIEGSCTEVHDSITRVKGSFKETIEGFRNLRKADIKVSTITTISATNISDIISIAQLLFNEGQGHIAFNACVPSLAYSDAVNEVIPLKAIGKAIDDISSFCRTNKIRCAFVTPFPHCLINQETKEDIEKGTLWLGSCHMYHGSGIIIDYDLNVLPCTHLTNIKLGSITKEDGSIVDKKEFEEFWEEQVFNAFRKRLWRYPSKNCEQCISFDKCGGGCPLFWLMFPASVNLKANGIIYNKKDG